MIRCLLIALLQFGTFSTFGQQEDVVATPRKNYIQFDLGLIHPRLIDEGYSTKLLFRGTNWKFGLSYGRETNKYLFSFSAEASAGKIESRSGHLPSDFQFIQPSLQYARKIRQVHFFGKQSTLLAGLSVRSTNYIISNQPVFDNVSVISLHGVYVNFGFEMNLSEKRRLLFSYRLPTAVYTNRLVWNGGASDLTLEDQEHIIRTLTTRGSLGYFDLLHNIQVNVDYEMRMGKNTQFVAGYRFIYVSTASSPAAHTYSNELLMGLKKRF
jgi:hypothetical protein